MVAGLYIYSFVNGSVFRFCYSRLEEMVTIKLNNNKFKLEGDPKVLNRAYKEFAIRHPNAFFMRGSMPKGWDGMVHPISDRGYCETGLLPKVIDWLEKYGVCYEFIDQRNLPEIKAMPVHVGDLKRRPYQRKAAWAVLKNSVGGIPFPRGIVAAATNAGKTLIAGLIHSSVYKAKSLIIVNGLELYNQFKDDLSDMFESWGYMQGKDVKWGDIMVCMLPTLAKNVNKYWTHLSTYNVLIYDECHIAVSKTARKVLYKLYLIPIRVGLSGTALRHKDKLKNLTVESFFGNEVFTIRNSELVEMGVSSNIVITMRKGCSEQVLASNYKEEFDKAITYGVERLDRAIDATRYHLREGHKPVLVVCKYIAQVEETYERYRQEFPDLKIEYIHHEIKDRKEKLDRFKRGETDILVASLIIKVGQNMPLIQYMQNLASGDSAIQALQLLGRALRSHPSKKITYYDDFYDEGRYLRRHSKHRLKYYKDEGLNVIEEYKGKLL